MNKVVFCVGLLAVVMSGCSDTSRPQVDEPEWIELVNCGQEILYLRDWSIADLSDTVVIDTSVYIEPGEYLVLSKDSLSEYYEISKENLIFLKKIPTFNDQEDAISLIEPAGNWVERVIYEQGWLEGEEFRSPSLERINPSLYENKSENWGPSVDPDGATPGRINSIFSDLDEKKTSLEVIPSPFSPDADGVDQ